jgi:hypothetical protein
MQIFWNLPIHSDGRYLGTSIGSRESGYSFLKLVTGATAPHHASTSLPARTTHKSASLVPEPALHKYTTQSNR